MSEAIKAGDLLMVVHSHCPAALAVEGGHIFKALSVSRLHADELLGCRHCREPYYTSALIAEVVKDGWHPVAWLKKIDPPARPQHVHTIEELTA